MNRNYDDTTGNAKRIPKLVIKNLYYFLKTLLFLGTKATFAEANVDGSNSEIFISIDHSKEMIFIMLQNIKQ